MAKLLIVLISTFSVVNCQLGFELTREDAQYLSAAEQVAASEVVSTQVEVRRHLKSLESVTTDYIATKLKQNVLKAVHTLTADQLFVSGEPRRSWKKALNLLRDEEAVPEGSDAASSSGGGEVASNAVDEGEAEEAGTTELTGLGTAVQINQNVFKFLGDTVKILAAGLGGGRRPGRKSSDPLFVVSKALMKERYSDQLLGLAVLLANETDGLQYAHGPLKTLRGTRLNLQQVLVNSVKKAQPVAEQLRPDSELNTYYFVETFRQSIDELLLNKLVKRDAIPDLYDGVHSSFELLSVVDKLSAQLVH